MASVEVLFGGKTRFAVLEALAEAKQQPVTAYQIAMSKGLDPAATYRTLAEFSEFGVVESGIKEGKERNQTFFKLSNGSGKAAAEFLRSLKQKTPKIMDFEKWISPEIQAERMAKVIRIYSGGQFDKYSSGKKPAKDAVGLVMSKRISGELSALIASSQIAFNELFDEKDGIYVLKA
jgi:hypothetical protein